MKHLLKAKALGVKILGFERCGGRVCAEAGIITPNGLGMFSLRKIYRYGKWNNK